MSKLFTSYRPYGDFYDEKKPKEDIKRSNYQMLIYETRLWLDEDDEVVRTYDFGVTRYFTFESMDEVNNLLRNNDLEIKHWVSENEYQCKGARIKGDDYCTTWYIVIQKVEHQKIKTNLLKK